MSAVTKLAVTVGAQAACEALAVPRASYYRRRQRYPAPPLKVLVRTPSPRALSAAERQVVLDTLHGERFQDRSPGHVVAALLSEDTWLCSERTMYRLLKTQGGTKERRRQREHPVLRETPVAGLRAQSGLDPGFHEGERARPRHLVSPLRPA